MNFNNALNRKVKLTVNINFCDSWDIGIQTLKLKSEIKTEL